MSNQQGFPNITSPIAGPEGRLQQAWYQLFIALWNRTGGGAGVDIQALIDAINELEAAFAEFSRIATIPPSMAAEAALGDAIEGLRRETISRAMFAAGLLNPQAIAATGDAAWSVDFDGQQDVSGAITLATVNPNVGTFGDSSNVARVTVNGKGLVTAVTTQPIAGGGFVTVTGTPAAGNLTKFSGAAAVTNGDLSGDVSTSGSLATILATVNANAGSFGDTTNLAAITVTAKGLTTVAANIPVSTVVGVGSALKWTTARTLTLGTDLAGSVAFDGSASFPLNATIASSAVTYAKIQNVSGNSVLLGRGATGAPAAPQELTLGAGLGMTTTVLSNTGVLSFNTRAGTVTLTSGDVTTALGFIPAAAATSTAWTPTILTGGAAVGRIYSNQDGHYVRNGNVVTATFDVGLSAKGSSTGTVTIGGLPFASALIPTCPILPLGLASPIAIIGAVGAGASAITVWTFSGAPTDDTALTNTTRFFGTLTYEV